MAEAVPKSGGKGFAVAILLMLLLMGGLIYWKMSSNEEEPVATTDPVPTATAAPTPTPDEPPPPPPPEDAGKEAAPKKVAKGGKVYKGGGGGCSGTCKGTASAALRSALRGKAGQARGCYERALRNNAALKGRLTVNVRIGPQGQVCSASVGSNTLGDPGVGSCVRQMFSSGKFPAPSGGCVDTAVPMNFVPRGGGK